MFSEFTIDHLYYFTADSAAYKAKLPDAIDPAPFYDSEGNYLETQEGRKLPVPHCIKGTRGHEICDELKNLKCDGIIDKPTFGSLDLVNILLKVNDVESINSITLCGLCTDICVVSNALLLKAVMPEINISVDASCCAGVTPQSHEAALTTMQMCQIELLYTIKNTFGRMN